MAMDESIGEDEWAGMSWTICSLISSACAV